MIWGFGLGEFSLSWYWLNCWPSLWKFLFIAAEHLLGMYSVEVFRERDCLISSSFYFWQTTKIIDNISNCKAINNVLYIFFRIYDNSIGSVIVIVLTSSVVDCGFDPRSGKTKNYKIVMCCFSAKHAALRRKGKDWLVRNEDNVLV